MPVASRSFIASTRGSPRSLDEGAVAFLFDESLGALTSDVTTVAEPDALPGPDNQSLEWAWRAFRPDVQWSAQSSGTAVVLRDLVSGHQRPFEAGFPVSATALSSDRAYLAWMTASRVSIRRVDSGQEIARLPDTGAWLRFSPDGRHLVVGSPTAPGVALAGVRSDWRSLRPGRPSSCVGRTRAFHRPDT